MRMPGTWDLITVRRSWKKEKQGKVIANTWC